MLSSLRVKDYALIDEVEIEFGHGLNIITGETGAGKSILMGALGLILGVRANAEEIRTGEDRCVVESIFELPEGHPCLVLLDEMGVEAEDRELILRREVASDRRSRCYANGVAITMKALHTLGRTLVDLHGQYEHQSLLDVERHLDFLDEFAGLGELREAIEATHAELGRLSEAIVGREMEAQQFRERRELLEFQLREISEADPEPEEDVRLEEERSKLANAVSLAQAAAELETALYQGEESVSDRLGAAGRILSEAARMDGSLNSKLEEVESLRYGAEELARFFADYAGQVEHNPERLAEVIERLELLARLKKKYGGSLDQVLAFRDTAAGELSRSEEVDADLKEIQAALASCAEEYSRFAQRLSEARDKAAGRLSSSIEKALRELGMPKVRFRVELSREENPDGRVVVDGRSYAPRFRGLERAEFFLSTNPGEAIRPLVKVASGGEISRIMLAMKTVISHADSVQVLIFDEIDIGISGRIAEAVGKKLKGLAKTHQTISITHLPQIAKMADVHFSVSKGTEKGRTITRVRKLFGEARTEDLAKLLGGEEISELTLRHAQEMLEGSE